MELFAHSDTRCGRELDTIVDLSAQGIRYTRRLTILNLRWDEHAPQGRSVRLHSEGIKMTSQLRSAACHRRTSDQLKRIEHAQRSFQYQPWRFRRNAAAQRDAAHSLVRTVIHLITPIPEGQLMSLRYGSPVWLIR